MQGSLMKINLILAITTLFISSVFGANAQLIEGDKEISFEVKKIGGINTSVSEFCPVIFGNKLIYTSDREYNLNNWGEEGWKRNGFLNLYAADIINTLSDTVAFGPSKVFSYKLLNDDHSGPICFASSGNEAFFTQVNHEKAKLFGKHIYKPQLHRAVMEKGKWNIVEKLPFNDPEYSFGHPCLINGDNTLIYVTDKPGGKGGKDLYWVERKGDTWGEPKNLGATINTDGDEMFPTFDNGKLYFSSTGHSGSGGLDIFVTEYKDGSWSTPENLGETINSGADDFGIVFNKNKTGFFSSNRDNGAGEDDIYFFKQIETLTVERKEVAGQFRYQNINGEVPEGLEVVLLDDEGEIVFRTTTDSEGKFTFMNIPGDSKYTIKLIGDNDEEVVLTVFGDDGNTMLMSNEEGEFVYRKLESENVGTLTFLTADDIDLATNTANFKGQFIYEQLIGEHPGDLEVYLVDDEGNIVYKTKTDAFGNFEFKSIPADKNFIVKIVETGEEVSLLIFNADDNIVTQLNKNSSGEFVYRKLSSDYGNSIAMLLDDEGDLQFPELTMRIVGEFVYKSIPGEDINGMAFEVLDADMNVIAHGVTDKNGKFRLINIPYEDEILFKIPEDSPWLREDIGLNILSKSHDVIVALDKDEMGIFRYKFIGHEDTYLDTIAIADTFDIAAPPVDDIIDLKNIYYDKGKYEVSGEDLENLKFVADLMNKDHRLKIHVGGHTSATSSAEFNMKLSKRRMQYVKKYLIDQGISSDRIIGKYFGEEKLVNKCENDEDCTEEQHRMNRRTELQLFY